MERKTIEENKNGARDYAVLVGLRSPVLGADSADEESLAELAALVETAGGESVGMILQSREKPDPHSFIGEGKVEEVKRMVENSEATMVIFDNDLSPSQVRVLTELCGVQVLDRSGLILDIFAQRARTKEGCLQVELAQYQYLLPRLIGMWSHLERQGGTGGSPIGTKGPGETQLETDRRHIRRKIDKLKEELEEVRRVRATQRQRCTHADDVADPHRTAQCGTDSSKGRNAVLGFFFAKQRTERLLCDKTDLPQRKKVCKDSKIKPAQQGEGDGPASPQQLHRPVQKIFEHNTPPHPV